MKKARLSLTEGDIMRLMQLITVEEETREVVSTDDAFLYVMLSDALSRLNDNYE